MHGPDWDASLVEAGRRLFRGPVTFLRGAASLDALPPADRPEIAFAGRSNVGKSSLVNALTGRKTLARISNTPGRTQELNFFMLGDALRLVDMPGYGYAQAPAQRVKAWTRLVHDYLRGRANLKRVYLLVDARHGLKPIDHAVMDALDKAAVSYQVVLTKSDKTPKSAPELIEATGEAIRRRPAAFPRVVATSSVTGLGIDDLRAEIAAVAAG
jgi:GTP-binding protein